MARVLVADDDPDILMLADLPIIMISALDPDGADVDVSLVKPFSLQALAGHMTRLLNAAPV